MVKSQSKEKITIEKLVESYSINIIRTAKKIINAKMNYDKWLLDDLIQQGYVGLIEAHRRYDFNRGSDFFWSYARKFVRGRMIDFIVQHFNFIRPSKKINSIMLRIKRLNLINQSPQYISYVLGCTSNMVTEAMYFLNMRYMVYLYEPASTTPKNHQSKLLIDIVTAEESSDDLFQIEVLDGFSINEKKIAQMLIRGYSRENIIEHCGIPASQLIEIIDEILAKCGVDNQKIKTRSEELLMQISNLEGTGPITQTDEKKNFDWIEIELIWANPKNPRKDLSVNIEQLQEVLTSKSWEEPVTCYQKGQYYILLAGHRRWNAAKALGHKKIPVFIVDPPSSPAEEKDRLGSLQSVQVDWTPYEIAKNIYDRWVYAGGISYSQLANKLGITKKNVETKIRVYKYYPRAEIEDKLSNGMYSITMLDYILTWIRRLDQYQPQFVESIGEDFIRQMMLTKYENKCFNSRITNDRCFVTNATSDEILSFLSDPTKTLAQSEIEMTMNRSKENQATYKEVYEMLNKSIESLGNLEWKDSKEAQQLITELDKLIENIAVKRQELLGGD
ncbi:RNA polymerase sigma factor (sigma-70 family) [Paenibacillus sp. PvR133]|uniref:sigma-70 family RNA polymerase sigma factor n=1 Tax=Paenibacillus sp. PvR133 TaxID=2806598 RepID=UPI001AE42708|nr:sigma-70 family RNA polymerase sigma factor [Paenibacillus sp. PvR133]MBP1174147.1 RNA polymerase sigma factor (sigma-70 family) [Paenibacillus sp. PvR133]